MKKQEKLKETTLNKVLDEANKSTKAAINQYKATNEAPNENPSFNIF